MRTRFARLTRLLAVAGVLASLLAWGGAGKDAAALVQHAAAQTVPIQHVIVIMQENRSFDSYFGTFPGADGLPAQGAASAVCVPDPATGTCVAPYHDANDINTGGPHSQVTPARMVTTAAWMASLPSSRRGDGRCAV